MNNWIAELEVSTKWAKENLELYAKHATEFCEQYKHCDIRATDVPAKEGFFFLRAYEITQ